MTLDDKHDVIFKVLEDDMIKSVLQGISEYLNSDEFKTELKMKLSNRNVEVTFKDMKNTKLIGEIETEKYSPFFTDELYEDIKNDLVIH